MTWALILFLFTFFLFLLPLLPGLFELLRPTDIEPLRVSQDYDSNPMHFAEGFRNYINSNFTELDSQQNLNGTLEGGTKYQLVGNKGVPTIESGDNTQLILSAFPLNLPAGEMFETEIYGRQNVTTGERSHFRALMSDQTLNIREHTTVLRWAHSDGDMMVGRFSKLYGRATSKQSIFLGEGVHFERLYAPIILSTARSNLVEVPEYKERTVLTELPDVKIQSGRRWVLNGHLDMPADSYFDGDIVTGTTASIGSGTHIKGSVKINAHDDVVYHLQNTGVIARTNKKTARGEVGDNVIIDGSLISSHDLTIGENCKILGPVIAEGLLVIGAGTTIGSPEIPTTVTSKQIIIESGCTIYGTLWATEGGLVRAEGSEASI